MKYALPVTRKFMAKRYKPRSAARGDESGNEVACHSSAAEKAGSFLMRLCCAHESHRQARSCAVNRPTKKKNYGVPCGRAGLPLQIPPCNIRSGNTFSTSIVPPQNYPLSWMGSNIRFARHKVSVTRNGKISGVGGGRGIALLEPSMVEEPRRHPVGNLECLTSENRLRRRGAEGAKSSFSSAEG